MSTLEGTSGIIQVKSDFALEKPNSRLGKGWAGGSSAFLKDKDWKPDCMKTNDFHRNFKVVLLICLNTER